MDINLFDYHLPPERVAQYPASKRDESRLLVVYRGDGRTEHRRFSDIVDCIRAGDVLVLNDSKVIHARLIGAKVSTGARVELFLVEPRDRAVCGAGAAFGSDDVKSGCAPRDIPRGIDAGTCSGTRDAEGTIDWEVLAKPAKRLKRGDVVTFGPGLDAEILEVNEDGGRVARFRWKGSFSECVERLGRMPLPPYIKRRADDEDNIRYQTVYSKTLGSVAAPTAGLHFTEELMGRVREKGATFAYVTLHVGLGTFRPVKTERIEDHAMHSEYFRIDTDTARAINAAKREGRRVICVGTTAVRTVESAALREEGAAPRGTPSRETPPVLRPCEGKTDIFIRPGYQFRVADGLLTNFHLPKSTLLMLVSAFHDREKVLRLYRDAIEKEYRFFSYGDAMLLL
ncbi:MAG: tRNA preQ1(34) S-adenosylmethionine ribosyltransferase-isomerase QueA [Clostridiales Family XIII bacterium]|nr:tRNA preQ1(34) S-adenosylmethionine ribosyltransferase-isomerase QueA [Clostridiales Family XIII bacterium]